MLQWTGNTHIPCSRLVCVVVGFPRCVIWTSQGLNHALSPSATLLWGSSQAHLRKSSFLCEERIPANYPCAHSSALVPFSLTHTHTRSINRPKEDSQCRTTNTFPANGQQMERNIKLMCPHKYTITHPPLLTQDRINWGIIHRTRAVPGPFVKRIESWYLVHPVESW